MASTYPTATSNVQDGSSIIQEKPTIVYRWPSRRRISLRRRRRVALPTVRLGGKKSNTPRKLLKIRLFRRVKLRWLKLKLKLKKLKNYYYSWVKDIIEAGDSIQSFQQRLVMEASFAVPVMGL